MTVVSPAPELLARAIEDLSAARALEAVTGTVAGAARELADADGATFVLREDGLCVYVDEHAIGPLWEGRRFPASACISGWAMHERQTALVADIYNDPRIPVDVYEPTFVRSMAMIPVRTEEPVAVGIYWADHHTPSTETLRQLEILANSASVALENLELRGALSRRALERDASVARADELEAAMHSLVHDLRRPLGATIGYTELISDEATDEDTVRHAEAILRAGEQVTAQIERMLSVYRITHHPIEPERIDLSALRRVEDRTVEVEVEDGLEVIADPILARLMLVNLLSNAVKYTAPAAQAWSGCTASTGSTRGRPSR